MNRIAIILAVAGLAPLVSAAGATAARPKFQVDVNMVVLSFTVTDGHGDYVRGLEARNFRVFEDGIEQKIASFAGAPASTPAHPALQAQGEAAREALPLDSSVFLLFDTSNHMYASFVYAEDEIANFIRGLAPRQAVAVYTFSRNLYRAAPLTRSRFQALRGLRDAVAGDDTAVFNALLMTIRDAAKVPGRKVIVVFSNSPDNASMISPDDVRRLSEDEGIPIYVISTQENNPVARAVFRRIAESTGGQAYFAREWRKQAAAFRAVERDLAHSYTLAYYPQRNPNPGFRTIEVRIPKDFGGDYRVHVRTGYHPHRTAP